MKKYIHYCWFGNKPMPKLAKKCLKSWKKYLPDYKIMVWNEKNFDVNITNFSKKAYEANKWAFVSDVARIYALKNYGGVYFDTDMLVTKNIDDILDNNFFVGWESENAVAVGVMGTKEKNNPIINDLWDMYNEMDFDTENMYSYAIPILLTKVLKEKYNLSNNSEEIQVLNNSTYIYPRDYFYPLSSDASPDIFTENTRMIHYYKGTWLDKKDQMIFKYERLFGKKTGRKILDIGVFCKKVIKKTGRVILYPYLSYKRKKREKYVSSLEIDKTNSQFSKLDNPKYIAFYNYEWFGTSIATKDMFENTIGINEIKDKMVKDNLINQIKLSKSKFLIFSAFADGWASVIKEIKNNNPDIRIKVIWHGSAAMNIVDYDYSRFDELLELLNNNYIESIVLVKKSMYEFYKQKGYNVEFLMNNLNIENKYKIENHDGVQIGVYASGDRWVKNFYNQLCAASLIKDSVVDCIPLSNKTYRFCNSINLKVKGKSQPIPREELLERIANNDINLYVTFTECAPLLPLESLELGVPCITGNNHHYFEGTELEKYLVVNEVDNIVKISEKIELCLKNKDKIIKLYKEWKKDYNKLSKDSFDNMMK